MGFELRYILCLEHSTSFSAEAETEGSHTPTPTPYLHDMYDTTLLLEFGGPHFHKILKMLEGLHRG
jgi:hypothetical protein